MREIFLVGRGGRAWLVPFVPGVTLIILGVLIALMPQLLIAMVAALFILAGIALASMGWRVRSLGGRHPPGGGFREMDLR